MKLSSLNRSLLSIGMDLRKARNAVRGLPAYLQARRSFEKQMGKSHSGRDFGLRRNYPVFGEDAQSAGIASGHYFHQDLYIAQRIFAAQPKRHIDVGSRIDGFVAHVASFRSIEVLDLRSLTTQAANIEFVQADLMDSGIAKDFQTDSLSCLHALEHFGLGRYGDQIDVDGWIRGLESLSLMLEPAGVLYLSVPSGREQRIEFNAHRVFSVPFLRSILVKWFEIVDFAFVDDLGNFHPDWTPNSPESEETFGANYGCSIWTLRKV